MASWTLETCSISTSVRCPSPCASLPVWRQSWGGRRCTSSQVVHGGFSQPVERRYNAASIFKRANGHGRITAIEGLDRVDVLIADNHIPVDPLEGRREVVGPDQRAGALELVTDELEGPNGLAFSPDERFLYVGNCVTQAYSPNNN